MLLGTLATAAATTVSAQAIDVSITPSNGTFTSPALQVTVVFCDYNTSLNLSSANMTLNGTSVRSSFTASSWHCPDGISSEKYSGTITLASGPNTFQASISDAVTGTSTGVAYDTLVMVQVTPKGTTINQPAHLTTTQMFSIQNKRSSAITFNLTPLCAASRNCSAPAQTSVAANSTGTVNMTYSVPPQSTSDVIKLRVASTSYPTDVDTGIVTVNAVAAMTVSFSNLNNDDQRLGLCAASCFAPVLAHSTLGYRSLGVNRAVTLQYHGDRSR
ncbi:MAG TPA: hypothetical protein VJU87_06760 [Gemmatimonadaceae bacterium]|nr:hypothetical protein [Gemmatimonadaceae bacterium]